VIPKKIVQFTGVKRNQIIQVAILKKNHSLLEHSFGLAKTKPFARNS
jgi:hypothetical protein